MTKVSWELPKNEPCFLLTPTTRNGIPSTRITFSSGSLCPKSRSAVSQPMTATEAPRSTSVGLISRPRSALKLEKLTYSLVTACTVT